VTRAPQPCGRHGCPQLLERGAAHPGCPLELGDNCPSDPTARRRKADKRRPTAAARGYDARWRRTRARKLKLTPHCEQPGCTKPATEVDHIDGLGPLGPHGHDLDNLRSLCKPHHAQRTARDQPGGWNAR
jgi:5-methylcytosine-specific restriction protein A